MTAPRRSLKACGLSLLAAAILTNLGARIVDAAALSHVVTSPTDARLPLRRVTRLDVPAFAGDLRVSPLGTRVAVATRNSPRDAAARFLVLGVLGGRTEVEGRDFQFIDESNALVVTESTDETALQQVELSGRPNVLRGSRIVLAGVTGLRLSSVEDSAWAGLGYDAKTEDFVGLIGGIGSANVKRHALEEDADGMVLSPNGRGVRVVSELTPLARLPWARLLYTASLPRESRVWRVDGDRQYLIAALSGQAGCHLVGHGLASVVCIGTHNGRTLLWRFDLATRPPPPLVIPGIARRSGVSSDGRQVALWTRDELLMVDLDLARANRWAVSPASGFPITIVPVAERLIVFSRSGTGLAIDVYDTRW